MEKVTLNLAYILSPPKPLWELLVDQSPENLEKYKANESVPLKSRVVHLKTEVPLHQFQPDK